MRSVFYKSQLHELIDEPADDPPAAMAVNLDTFARLSPFHRDDDFILNPIAEGTEKKLSHIRVVGKCAF